MNVSLVLQVLAKRTSFQAVERLSRPRLLDMQARALASLRRYVYSHSPFYRQFHANRFDAPLHELPVLTKRMMMEHFDELVTDRTLTKAGVEAHLAAVHGGDDRFGPYRVCSSSGSTGSPAFFVFNPNEWVSMLASFERGMRWTGGGPRLTSRRRMATVASTSAWHLSARGTRSLANWWLPILLMDAGDPIERIVQRLNDWQPELLFAYPSIARLLAAEQRAARLRIAPEVIFTGAEVLTATMRTCIEETWGIQPFEQYAASEADNIAAECEQHAGLHLFEDRVIAEVVDREGRAVPAGTGGAKLLITVLSRRVQPLIRYELGDAIQLSPEPCACGRPFPLIQQVQGRTLEFLELAGIGGQTVSIHPVAFHRLLDHVPAAGWQVVRDEGGLLIRLRDLQAGFPVQTLIDALTQELNAHNAIALPIRIERVSETDRGFSGKALRIVSRGVAKRAAEN